jgi:5-methylcytosine-specific restriction endonuclease McrA
LTRSRGHSLASVRFAASEDAAPEAVMSPIYSICSVCHGAFLPRDLDRGRCRVRCAKEYQRQRNARPQHKIWNSAPWRQARKAARERDGQRCAYVEASGERCPNTTDLTVHHRVALKDGGAMYDLTNLVTLCRAHHGSVEGVRAGAMR